MPIKTHTFAGRRYRIRDLTGVHSDALAKCDYDKRVIRIPHNGDTMAELDAVIHEALHAACPWLAEYVVDRAATSIARLLWRLEWRKLDG